jgi:sarcosine oxidase subunit gamma
LRLKSWLPQHARGGTPIVLAGRELPSRVGAASSGPIRVLCVGPAEWLMVSQAQSGPDLHKELAAELSSHGLALVDLTDGLVVLEVQGYAARDILSKGCGLDLHPRSFPVASCARTRFAQTAVVIACLDDPNHFELLVGRSYHRYLHDWLVDAAAGLG